MKIALVYTPALDSPNTQPVDVALPPIGIAYLGGLLKQQGYDYDLLDLNLEFVDHLATNSDSKAFKDVLQAMRTEQAYDGATAARFTVAMRLESVSCAILAESCLRKLASGDLSALQSGVVGPFLAQQAMRLAQYDVVGFSCIFEKQWHMTYALIRILKLMNPNVHILLGGPGVPEEKTFDADLKAAVAMVAPAEGEAPLLRYLQENFPDAVKPRAAANGASAKKLPVVGSRADRYYDGMESSPLPDYKSLFDRYQYYAPGKIVPLAITRGCYWAKCEFCGYGFADWDAGLCTAPYRRQSAPKVAHTIAALKEELGTPYFYFSADVVDPRLLSDVADQLIETSTKVNWYSTIRLQKTYMKPGFIEKLAKSGCRTLNYGMESASQRILDAMVKGMDAADIIPFQKKCQEYDILVRMTSFIGYPTETPAEALDTIRALAEMAEEMPGFPAGQFMATKDAILTRKTVKGEALGLTIQKDERDHEVAAKEGMDWQATARQFLLGAVNFFLDPTKLALPIQPGNGMSFLWACRYSMAEMKEAIVTARKKEVLAIMPLLLESMPTTWYYLTHLGCVARYDEVLAALAKPQEVRAAVESDDPKRRALELIRGVIAGLIQQQPLPPESIQLLNEVLKLDYYLAASAVAKDVPEVNVDESGSLTPEPGDALLFSRVEFDVDPVDLYRLTQPEKVRRSRTAVAFGRHGLYAGGDLVRARNATFDALAY